nr:MAG TPA: minor tail protein [Caudoviricetes sp.]
MAANTLKGITVEIGGDVTDLASALAAMGKRSRELGTELSSVERALKFNPDSVELLGQKEVYASRQAQVLEARLDAVRQGLGKVEQGSDAFYRLQREAVTSESKLKAMQAKAADAARVLADLKSGGSSAADGLAQAGSAADGLGRSLEQVKNGAAFSMGEDLLDAAKELAAASFELSQSWDDADAKVRAATGSASDYAQVVSGVAQDLYADGWGDSVDQLTDSVLKAREVLGELSGTDLSTVTESALTWERVFGSDVTESLRGVNVLMDEFGLSASQACDLMTAGMQRGLDYTDELGDNLSEYAGRWAESGTSATQYFSMLQAGVDAGAYSLDKVGDYLNEFLTSLSDGRMEAGIGGFSRQTQALWESYKAGGATAQQMLDAVVGELRDCGSETEALTKASDLWSSLGEDNALGVITALADVRDSYGDTAGAAESAAQAMEESSSQRLESFKRTALGLLEPIADTILGATTDVLGAVEPAAEAFDELDDGTKRAVVSGVALAAAYPKVSAAIKTARAGVEGLSAAEQAAAAKAKALATAQKALKASLAGVGAAVAVMALSAFVSQCTEWAEAAKEAEERSDRLAEAAKGVTSALSQGSGDGFSGVSASAAEATQSVSALRDEIAETVTETLDLYSSISSDNFSMESKNAEVERLAQEIEELSAKSSLTADEQARLSEAVRKFNEATGAGIEVVDSSTGKLNANAEAIDKVTEAYKNQARIKGYQDALSGLYAQQADALMQVQQAQDGLTAAEDRLAQAQANLEAAEADPYVMMAPSLYADYQTAVASASWEVESANAAMDEATTSYMGLSESVGVYEDALSAQVDQQDEASGSADGLAESEEAAAEAVTALTDASEASVQGLRASADTVEEAVALLDGLADGSRDAGDAIEDAFRGAMGDGKTVTELTKEVNSALKEAGVITDDLTEREVLLGYATGKTGDEMVAYARDIQAAKDAQSEQEKAAEEARKAVEEFRKSVSDLVEDTPGLAKALTQAGMDAGSFADMLAGAGVSVEDFKATYESLGDVANPLQAIEQETGVYTWQMAQNLQTNMDAANQWADGMTELYSRCTNDNEVAFAQYVEAMGSDNLEFLNYLLYDADVSFSELADLYAQGGQTQADAALRVQKAAIEAMIANGDAYYNEAGEVVDKAGNVIVDSAGNVAQQATDAMAQGIEDGSSTAATSAELLGDATVDGLMELPSEMQARGEAAGGYLGIGFGSDAARAYMAQGAASLVNAARDSAIELGSEMQARGEYAGGMFAQGIAGAGVSGDALSQAVAGSLSTFADNMATVGAAAAIAFADSLLEGYTVAWQNGQALAQAAEGGAGPGASSMESLGEGAGKAYGQALATSSNLSICSTSAKHLLDALYGGLADGMTGAIDRGQAHGGSYAAGILYGYTAAYTNAQSLVTGALEAMSGYDSQAQAAGESFGEAWARGASSALAVAVSNIRANISTAVSNLYTVGRT